ncbi:unnamed protein product [marine sediment metagenome]|uniref:Uncharacterized protein n=1 Tax=marine sediment metagenome TaxID=412755 RepID=X0ZFH1_9ZZZZ
MTTINGKKKSEKEKERLKENLFFHLDEDLIETEDDINRLKEILENEEISDKTKAAFRSANKFNEKLIKNNFSISLEEIARENKP